MVERSYKSCACTFCGGFARCGLMLELEDDKLVGVKGDSDLVPPPHCTRGWLEDDGKAIIEYHYHKDRINYPMKRLGERGEGRWRRISWEEALNEISNKFEELRAKYGSESLIVCKGTLHHSDYQWPSVRFSTLYGTPNYIGNEQVCYGPEVVSGELSFGWAVGKSKVPGITPRLIVFGGYDPAESSPDMWALAKSWIASGAKLIAIDPRMTESVRNSHIWLQIRPGSDIALLLAWLNTIVKEKLYEHDFVIRWTSAPFLVSLEGREPKGWRILRGSDVDPEGSLEDFVVWNVKKGTPSIWKPKDLTYEPEETEPVLTGSYDVKLASGNVATCKTVWQLLTERVQPCTPEWAEKLTWVRADRIVETARMYATIRPALFFANHVYESFAPGSGDIFRLRNILIAICRHLEPGGDSIHGPYPPDRIVHEFELETYHNIPEAQKQKQIGGDRFRVFGFPGYDLKTSYQKEVWGVGSKYASSCQAHAAIVWRSIFSGKPHPLKAITISGSNPIQKYANAKLVYEALKKLDLIVVLEFFETPTAALADYIFPMTDGLERPCLAAWTMSPVIRAGRRALKPEFERKDDYDFWRGLGLRLGQEKHWPWKNLEEIYDYCAKRGGYHSFADMVAKKPIDVTVAPVNKFATPSRRVEIYTTIYEMLGYDPLPSYKEPSISPLSTPSLAKKYPLILVTVNRHLPFHHSQYYMVPSIRKIHPNPIMEIHPHTARPLEIFDGDWVWIKTRMGRCRQRARLNWGIHPRVVLAQHCWWFPEQPGSEPSLHGAWESNINVCTEDDPELCDPVFGTWAYSPLLCKVCKA